MSDLEDESGYGDSAADVEKDTDVENDDVDDSTVDDVIIDDVISTSSIKDTDEKEDEEPEYDIQDEEMDDLDSEHTLIREEIIVPNDKRMTSNMMTLFEMTEIINCRATAISATGHSMIPNNGLTDPVEIAKRELMERMCPLVIRRNVGIGKNKEGKLEYYVELWSANEMTFPKTYDSM